MYKVNFGSYTVMFKNDWINVDLIPMYQYAKDNGYNFVHADIRYELPFPNHCTSLIFASHVFEHISYDDGGMFLARCKRIMVPGGVMRIAVPDLEIMAKLYLQGEMGKLDRPDEPAASDPNQAGKFWKILTDGHEAAYDYPSLKRIGELAGFKVERKAYGEGHPQMIAETKDLFPELSLYVEMTA